MDYYILDSDHQVHQVGLEIWGQWTEGSPHRFVARSLVDGRVVSTAFIGLSGILFETMVFPSEKDFTDLFCHRVSTWEEALAAHEEGCNFARTYVPEEKDPEDRGPS